MKASRQRLDDHKEDFIGSLNMAICHKDGKNSTYEWYFIGTGGYTGILRKHYGRSCFGH